MQTKYITVRRSDITILEVSDSFDLKNASQDDLRSLLTSSIPIKEVEDIPLEIRDHEANVSRFFNAENL